jgi:hypothetical protein
LREIKLAQRWRRRRSTRRQCNHGTTASDIEEKPPNHLGRRAPIIRSSSTTVSVLRPRRDESTIRRTSDRWIGHGCGRPIDCIKHQERPRNQPRRKSKRLVGIIERHEEVSPFGNPPVHNQCEDDTVDEVTACKVVLNTPKPSYPA